MTWNFIAESMEASGSAVRHDVVMGGDIRSFRPPVQPQKRRAPVRLNLERAASKPAKRPARASTVRLSCILISEHSTRGADDYGAIIGGTTADAAIVP